MERRRPSHKVGSAAINPGTAHPTISLPKFCTLSITFAKRKWYILSCTYNCQVLGYLYVFPRPLGRKPNDRVSSNGKVCVCVEGNGYCVKWCQEQRYFYLHCFCISASKTPNILVAGCWRESWWVHAVGHYAIWSRTEGFVPISTMSWHRSCVGSPPNPCLLHLCNI